MEWVETTGRSVEEAKEAALDELGVDDHDAEFEILEEPKMGLFGRVRGEARVRARVRPTRPRPKEDRRDRRRKRSGERTGPEVRSASRGDAGGEAGPEAAHDDRPTKEAAVMEREVPLAEQADVAREFLDGLVSAFGADGRVDVHDVDEETVELAVVGGDLGLLIGPKGATLAAIQELTRTVVQRRTGSRHGRILVDVGGYREKRRLALGRWTSEIAAEVKATGVRRALEPMSAADRKVVHDTVNEIDGVSTTSEGEDPVRRVVIEPS